MVRYYSTNGLRHLHSNNPLACLGPAPSTLLAPSFDPPLLWRPPPPIVSTTLILGVCSQVDAGGLGGCQNHSWTRDDRPKASKKASPGSAVPPTRVLRVTGSGCQSHVTAVLLDTDQAMPRGGLMGMLGF